MIDTTFTSINRQFILLIHIDGNDNDFLERNSFDRYYILQDAYMMYISTTDQFLHQPIKHEQEKYEKFNEVSRNNDYTT